MHGRTVQKDLAHLEAPVAEQRERADHHRDASRGEDRVAGEGVDAREAEPLQLQRGVGEVAQQADVEPVEIELGTQRSVGFALDDRGDLAAQQRRGDERREQ